MAVRKLANSWQYDFTLQGHGRRRKAGFRTKAEAREAEQRAREDLIAGHKRVRFADAYEQYMSATTMKDRSRDSYENLWPQIKPVLGQLFIEEVDTSAMDALKRALPANLGPKSVNNRLALVRAILRFCWKRGRLAAIPYVPTERAPKKKPTWYSEKERDRFLAGMFELQPQWYLFFYLSARLGLRVSEVYAISRSRLRDIPPQLIVDRAVQRGTKERLAVLATRKNNEAYVLELSEDILGAIRWHARQGYAGPEFLFSEDGTFPRCNRQLQTPHGGRAASTSAPTAESSRAWSAFGREPGRHQRSLDQGSSSPARASIRAKHAHVRAPWLACATAFSRVFAARCGTA
jgi:integrase